MNPKTAFEMLRADPPLYFGRAEPHYKIPSVTVFDGMPKDVVSTIVSFTRKPVGCGRPNGSTRKREYRVFWRKDALGKDSVKK